MANEFKIKNGLIVSGSADIEQDLRVRGTLTVDELHASITTSSIIYESGSTKFGNTLDDEHSFTGSVDISGSITLNGQAIGTGKLDETDFNSFTSSYTTGSFTGSFSGDGASLYNVPASGVTGLNLSRIVTGSVSASLSPDGFNVNTNTSITGALNVSGEISSQTTPLVSGSSQIEITGTTGYLTFSSSIATTDLNQSNRLTSIENKTGSYATTGSNLFIGTQTHSGSILPSVDNAYDLGSEQYQWRDVYISSGSLYIDGTKVISSTAQELVITTDNGQSIKILEGTTDSIVLQTADGDIELKSSADGDILLDPTNGKIMLKGPVEILNGSKIQSSVGGTPVVFANDVVISGSIDITGTIEGINLTDYSSSVNTRLTQLEGSGENLNLFTSSTNLKVSSLETTTGSLNTYTSSNDSRISSIETTTGSLNTYTSSNVVSINSINLTTSSLNSYTSSNITNINAIHTSTSSLNSYTSSNTLTINEINSTTSSLNSYTSSNTANITSIQATTASLNTYTSSNDTRLNVAEGSISFLNTYTSSANNRFAAIENKTGSYATTGSNQFNGSQTITGSLIVTDNFTVLGSSSIVYSTASQLIVEDNVIVVNASYPAERFAGLEIHDSGSNGSVTASLFWDGLNNRFIYRNTSDAHYGGAMFIAGPRNTGSLGDEPTLTNGRIPKSIGGDHIGDSIISEFSGSIGINGNLVITGSLFSSATPLVSGSSQISHDSTTGYVANQHIDHSTVSISAGNGLSGGGDITATRTITLDTSSSTFTTGVKSKMNADGVISGSAQVISALPTGTVSGSSQVLSGTGIFSGSAQLPSGLVSGSSQVLAGTTIHSGTFFNNISVVSGSGQISFNGITDKPTLVSGSSQVSFTGITDKPSLVSGSSQISYPSLSNIPGGIVSGSVQVDLTSTTNYSTGIKTRLNAEGVISGSSQVTGIGNSQLSNSSFHVGTTSISLGRASSAQALTGVSIDGNAGTATSTATLTSSGTLTTQAGSGTLTYSSPIVSSESGLFSTSDNSNSIITFNRHPGAYYSQLGFNSSGTIFYRSFNNTSINTSQAWKTIIDSGNIGSQTVATAGNATTAGGLAVHSDRNNEVNKIVRTDANGYIQAGWINTTSGDNGTSALTRIYASDDAYLRYYTPANFRQVLDVPTRTGGSASGNWGINVTGTANNITAYTINQNLGTSNAPTFAGADLTGRLYLNGGSYEGSILFGSATTWRCGIRQHDDADAELRIWTVNNNGMIFLANGYNGEPADIARPTDGLVVGPANNVGIGNFSSADPGFKLHVKGTVGVGGDLTPTANNAYNLGSASLGWANIYTNDLHLSNMNKPEGNEIDGTNGTWTIQEGLENLYIINNNNGKKYKIDLTEII